MKTLLLLLFMAVLATVAALAPGMTYAEASSFQAEGTAAIGAGAVDPPDPVEGCRKAKQDAKDKAAKAGYTGHVEWARLSVDSDYSLKTLGVRGVGYFFIFTARGTFLK